MNEEGELVPMKKKVRFDDDLRDLPQAKTSALPFGSIRLFTSAEGNRVITKLDKEKPEIKLFLRKAEINPKEVVVNLNCQEGALGIVTAINHKDSKFYLVDSNLESLKIAQRNVVINMVQNAEVITGIGENDITQKGIVADVVIYTPEKFISNDVIRTQIEFGKSVLSRGGKLYLVADKRAGANRHINDLSEIFGSDSVEIIGRSSGFRVAVAVKKDENKEQGKREKNIVFNVLGHDFSVVTEPSLFSKDKLDEGTRLLMETVALNSFRRLLDIGCGWGAIGIIAATLNKNGKVIMTDIDLRATELAKRNVMKLNINDRVEIVPTIDLKTIPGEFDLILSNPPFHQDYGTLTKLFRDSRGLLEKNGKIYIVVEKTYLEKFKNIFQETFGNFSITANNEHYFILKAKK